MRHCSVTTALMCALLFMVAIPGTAQLPRLPRVPDAEDIAGEVLRGRIPGLDQILREDPAIATTFDDAVYGVSIIDGFDPVVTAPMSQLPYTGDGAFLVALPGVFELEAQSFCLHAGTHGPGQGEGYLWAPLRGAQARMIQHVMDAYMQHPELDQRRVQSLIWGIQSKARISNMNPEVREVARVLLTREQIRSLDGGALGDVPRELFDQAFVDIPREVRMVLEAEAMLRNRLRQEVFNFAELERISVLAGDPPRELNGEDVPRGRWSFEPSGFFVRYEPRGYRRTQIQLYAPERFRAVTDAMNRITSLTDHTGNIIELNYAGDGPTAADGDTDVLAHALEAVTLIAAGREPVEWRATGEDIVLTGLPSGRGSLPGELNALYQRGVTALSDVRELARNVDGATPDSPLVGNVIDLAHLSTAVQRLVERNGVTPDGMDLQVMAHRAVASELAVLLLDAEEQAAFRSPKRETRLAVLPWATGAVIDLGRPAWTQLISSGTPEYRPSRGTGTPASRGRQRLGTSGASHELPTWDPRTDRTDDPRNGPSGSQGKSAYGNARDGINAIQRGQTVVNVATGPRSWARGRIGFGIPNYLFGRILDFNFDTWGKATAAIGTDPPVADYDVIAMPEPISIPTFAPDEEVSPEHTAAVQALADVMTQQLAIVRAANVTEDRLGGAMAAEDEEWTMRQAAALTDYKHQAGHGMMEIARGIEDVLDALRNSDVSELIVTREAVLEYQQRLRTDGFDAEERQAAQILLIDDEKLQTLLAERIAADPDELTGDLMVKYQDFAQALWWLGMSWRNLPASQPGG